MVRRKSSKQQAAEKNRGNTSHALTLHHRRLYDALILGLRSDGDKGRKWHSADIEIQRHVLRSMDAFLDCISSETVQHPLVKGSIGDMVRAFEGIIQVLNEATMNLASNVAVKMVNTVPSLILQTHLVDFVLPLTTLLTSRHLKASVSGAIALEVIISNLSSKREGEVGEILTKTDIVCHLINNIQGFSNGTTLIEHHLVMVSLLGKILLRWQPYRFSVWSDAKLMKVLGVISLDPDISVKVAVLQLYSALALCGNGAQKLLENAGTVLPLMVHCMDKSNVVSVRMKGFKLARCLAMNERCCSKMMAICCEPIVNAIVDGMRSWESLSGRIPTDHMSFLIEACRLALITRWAGEHHKYFWKLGIGSVLLKLLINDFQQIYSCRNYSHKIITAHLGLRQNHLLVIRPFIWDILGGLATHCLKGFNANMYEDESCIDSLLVCVCWAFVDSIVNTMQLGQNDIDSVFRDESATRTVVMLIHSPSYYVVSHTTLFLSEVLKSNGNEYLEYLLDKLRLPQNKLGILDALRTVIYLMSLTCYSSLHEYSDYIVRRQGINTLVVFVRWCLSNNVHMKRANWAPHLYSSSIERTCCWDCTEDWDGDDMPLLFSLWGLSELIHQSNCVKTHLDPDIFVGQVGYNETQLVSLLQEICCDTSSPGPRWYAAYILSHVGRYGFQSKLGSRIGKLLNDKKFGDLVFIFTNGEPLNAHRVILSVRCPLLLPRSLDGVLVRQDGEKCERPRKEVRLNSDKVDREALVKLLEYAYLGHFQAGKEIVENFKGFARRGDMQRVLQIISKETPKWGTPFPTFDLTSALEPTRHHLSDIVVAAEAVDMINWRCPNFPNCSISAPHMHLHKVLLSSSSTYFRGMFRSGMLESRAEIVTAPVSWEALVKVVKWFYSDELPKPVSGCLWENLDAGEKLNELFPYVELCWLAEYWCLGDDFRKHCTRTVISRLDSAIHLSVKLIQIAWGFHQKELVEVAVSYMAPHYIHLWEYGELVEVDDELIDMVRAASVRLSQEGGHFRS